MATTYKVLDATLTADNTYRVTVQANRNAAGNQVFEVTAQAPPSNQLPIQLVADVAAFLLATGLPLNTLKSQSYTVN